MSEQKRIAIPMSVVLLLCLSYYNMQEFAMLNHMYVCRYVNFRVSILIVVEKMHWTIVPVIQLHFVIYNVEHFLRLIWAEAAELLIQ